MCWLGQKTKAKKKKCPLLLEKVLHIDALYEWLNGKNFECSSRLKKLNITQIIYVITFGSPVQMDMSVLKTLRAPPTSKLLVSENKQESWSQQEILSLVFYLSCAKYKEVLI